MDQHDWQIVRATPLFQTMSKEATERLLDGQGARVFEKGSLLFQQGTPADYFFVIIDGWVKIYRATPDGTETVVHVFRRGETFAEAALFLGGRYPVSAETVSTSRLLRISGQALRRSIRDDPDVALAMLASASHHLKLLVEQIELMKRLTGPQKLASFLVGLCPLSDGRCKVMLPYEKSLVANRLGMEPESLSRAINKLRPFGVQFDKDEVVIEDVQRLAKFSDVSQDEEEG